MKVEEFHSLLAERDHLLTEVKVLKQEKEILVAEVQQKDDELQEIRSGAMNGIFSALNPHGGLKKITQKASRVAWCQTFSSASSPFEQNSSYYKVACCL